MNWVNLLAATIRLTDAYDSNRDFGSSATQPGPENRRRHSEGLWFELAVFILEYLQRKDDEIPGAFVSREPLYQEIREIRVFRNVENEDVNYIVNLLASPCELKFHIQNIRGTFDTALIEKARAGAGIRLSPTGRSVCLLAYGIDDWLYMDIDVWKLTRTLELGKFDDFLKRTDSIITVIRNKSYEITRIKEMPALSERKKKIMEDKEVYLSTVEKTQKIVSDMRELIDTDEAVQKRIEEWAENHPDDFIDEIVIKNRLNRLLQILESFSRNFSSLIDETQTKRNTLVDPVNFYETGMFVVKHWSDFSAETYDSLFLLNGFWLPSNHQATVGDMIRRKKPSADIGQTRMVISLNEPEQIRRSLEVFLEQHSTAFRERCLQGSPVSLSEILAGQGWNIRDISHFASLIGVFTDPSKLRIEQGRIVVAPNEYSLVRNVLPFGKMDASDIQMLYLPDE